MGAIPEFHVFAQNAEMLWVFLRAISRLSSICLSWQVQVWTVPHSLYLSVPSQAAAFLFQPILPTITCISKGIVLNPRILFWFDGNH